MQYLSMKERALEIEKIASAHLKVILYWSHSIWKSWALKHAHLLVFDCNITSQISIYILHVHLIHLLLRFALMMVHSNSCRCSESMLMKMQPYIHSSTKLPDLNNLIYPDIFILPNTLFAYLIHFPVKRTLSMTILK